MTNKSTAKNLPGLVPSDDDIYRAMQEIHGYLDITAGDFKDLYHVVYQHTLQRLSQSVKAGDIMSKEVISVSAETSLREAAAVMARSGVSGVPVTNDASEVLGVLSGKDFLTNMSHGKSSNFMTVFAECLSEKGCAASPILGKKVQDIMSSPAITVTAVSPLSELFVLLQSNSINRLPVIDQHGHLIGIVSREDILQTHIPAIQGTPQA